MKTEPQTCLHRMTLFNEDLAIAYHIENDRVKITEINLIHSNNTNLLKFISGRVFQLIVDDIEKETLKSKWID